MDSGKGKTGNEDVARLYLHASHAEELRGAISIVEVASKRAARVVDLPAPFAALDSLVLEEKSDSELHVTRLIEICITSRDTEDSKIIKIQRRQAEASPVEGIEEISTQLNRSRLRSVDLLQNVEVFCKEWLGPQAAVCRSSIAKEPQWISVVRRVGGTANIANSEAAVVRRWSGESGSIQILIARSSGRDTSVKGLTGDVGSQVAIEANEVEKISRSAGDERH